MDRSFDGFGVALGVDFDVFLCFFDLVSRQVNISKMLCFHGFYSSFHGFSHSGVHVFSCNFQVVPLRNFTRFSDGFLE